MSAGRRDWRRRDALFHDAFELAGDASPSDLLRRVVKVAVEVAEADHGFLVAVDEMGEVHDVVTSGVEEERRRLDRALVDKGLIGRVLQQGAAVCAERPEDDPSLVAFPRSVGVGSVLGLPISLWGRAFGVICLARAEGAEAFCAEDEAEMLSLGAHAGVALDHARLRQESRVRAEALVAVSEVSRAILEGRETDDVLQLIAARARTLVCSSLGAISTPEPDGETILQRVAEGDRAHLIVGKTFPAAGSISADVMATRRPLLIPEVSSDSRVVQPVVQLEGLGPGLFVPLAVGDRVFGTLAVVKEAGARRFSADDVLLMQAFAAEAAIALQYGQVRAELGRLALLEERERIAMDLHDGVIQALFVVGLSLQGAQAVVHDPEEMELRLRDAIGSIDRAIRDLREYVFGLRPNEGDDQLERGLREIGRIFGRAGNLSMVVEVDPQAAARLEKRSTDIIQAAREAVSNAVRHSGGDEVTLKLAIGPDASAALLEVTDNGVGFEPDACIGKGNGLANLRSRAESLGGSLTLEAAPGQGSAVRIQVPLSR